MSEEKGPRKNFPQLIVDQILLEQDFICATKGCFNPLTSGFRRHHKDKDPSNIKKENCQLLCIECHFATYGVNNPLIKHRNIQRQIMNSIANVLKHAISGSVSGSSLERILAGFVQAEQLSWKEKGLNVKIEYPSANFALMKQMMKSGIVAETYLEALKEGIKLGAGTKS